MATVILVAVVSVCMFRTARWSADVDGGKSVIAALSRRRAVTVGSLLVMLSGIVLFYLISVLPATGASICM